MDEARQRIIDEEHLRLLSIFCYVKAGVVAAFSLFGLVYIGMGAFAILAGAHCAQTNAGPPPAFVGWIFLCIGGGFLSLGWVMAALTFLAGRYISARRHYAYGLVVAGLNCLSVPYGTLLGVFAFLVLLRSSVRELFEKRGEGRT